MPAGENPIPAEAIRRHVEDSHHICAGAPLEDMLSNLQRWGFHSNVFTCVPVDVPVIRSSPQSEKGQGIWSKGRASQVSASSMSVKIFIAAAEAGRASAATSLIASATFWSATTTATRMLRAEGSLFAST